MEKTTATEKNNKQRYEQVGSSTFLTYESAFAGLLQTAKKLKISVKEGRPVDNEDNKLRIKKKPDGKFRVVEYQRVIEKKD